MSERRSAARPLLLLTVALAGLIGCGTRVLELTPQTDAATPAAMCNDFRRADGAACKLCFGPAGAVTLAACGDPPPPPDAGDPVMPRPPPSCTVSTPGNDRCLICHSPTMGDYRACLKCEPALVQTTGDQCRTCFWTDDDKSQCLQCFDASGATVQDSCDRVRAAPVTYPPGTDAGAAGR